MTTNTRWTPAATLAKVSGVGDKPAVALENQGEAPLRVSPGDVVGGKYQVERVAGVGRAGWVAIAHHREIGQRVALRVLSDEIAKDPELVERILTASRAAMRLNNEHVVRVLDVTMMDDGAPVIVLEYIHGRTLESVIRRTCPLPFDVAVECALQVCEALAEAHGANITHGAVHPRSIFLTITDDGRPCVKLGDFGLSAILGDVPPPSARTQRLSEAPFKEKPWARFDILLLATCLYSLLTGRVLDANAHRDPRATTPPPPVPPPSDFYPDLPAELEKVVLRCFDPDEANRYASAAALAFGLEPFAHGEVSGYRIIEVMHAASVDDPGLPPANLMEASLDEAELDEPPKIVKLTADDDHDEEDDTKPSNSSREPTDDDSEIAETQPSRSIQKLATLIGAVVIVAFAALLWLRRDGLTKAGEPRDANAAVTADGGAGEVVSPGVP